MGHMTESHDWESQDYQGHAKHWNVVSFINDIVALLGFENVNGDVNISTVVLSIHGTHIILNLMYLYLRMDVNYGQFMSDNRQAGVLHY